VRIFYDSKGVPIKYNLKISDIINVGSTGRIYKVNDDVCLKMIDKDRKLVDFEVLSLISKLKLSNFYEIFDFLYNRNNKNTGYTMKYYKSENINVLTMPCSYILDNFNYIYNSVIELSNKGVVVTDMSLNNIILNSSSITVIDADYYYFNRRCTYNRLLADNLEEVLLLFASLLYDSIKIFDINQENSNMVYNSLNMLINSFSDISSLSSELAGYKYPIDYIKKYVKMR